jgi:hypothetical protein
VVVPSGDRDSIRAARGTLEHRSLNASLVAFSDDSMVNALPLNSLCSVANAIAAARTISQAVPS